MSYASALSALEGIVSTYATANSLTVAWDNTAALPTHASKFLVCTFLPAQSRQASVGASGKDASPGIFQVAVYTHRDRGIGDALAIADALVGEFRRKHVTVGNVPVYIARAWASPGYPKDDFFVLPVSVMWEFIS